LRPRSSGQRPAAGGVGFITETIETTETKADSCRTTWRLALNQNRDVAQSRDAALLVGSKGDAINKGGGLPFIDRVRPPLLRPVPLRELGPQLGERQKLDAGAALTVGLAPVLARPVLLERVLHLAGGHPPQLHRS